MKIVCVPDIIGEIVAAVSDVLTPKLQLYDPNIVNVNYQFGPAKEINATLESWTKSPDFDKKKYPCVWLLQSFQETRGRELGKYGTVILDIIIARRNSDDKLKSADRLENNFKPVLYPVYYEFLNQLTKNKSIDRVDVTLIPHKKIDWPYWGGTNEQLKNPFSDKIDIIELKDLTLTLKQPC